MTNPPPTPDDNASSRDAPELPAWARKPATGQPMSDDRLAAFIGHKWESSYRRKFAPFMQDPRFVPTWNWSAALATPYWFLYRKLYLPFVVFLFAPGAIARIVLGPQEIPTATTTSQPEMQQATILIFAFWLSAAIAAGGTANWLLFRRARVATHVVAQQRLPDPDAHRMLERIGGVHRVATILFVVLAATVFAAQFMAGRPA